MTLSRLPDDVGENPLKLTVDERNNCVVELDNVMMCERTLQIGFFFDGTRNNMKYDEPRNPIAMSLASSIPLTKIAIANMAAVCTNGVFTRAA